MEFDLYMLIDMPTISLHIEYFNAVISIEHKFDSTPHHHTVRYFEDDKVYTVFLR